MKLLIEVGSQISASSLILAVGIGQKLGPSIRSFTVSHMRAQ